MKLTTNQVCCIIMLVTIGNKLLSLPAIMYETSGSDALLIVLLNLIFAFFVFWMFAYVAKKYPNITFKQFATKYLTKAGYILILLFFGLYYLIKLVLTINEGEIFLSETIYVGFSSGLYIIPTLLVAIYFVYKGLKPIARTNELLVRLILIGLIVTIILSLPKVRLDTLLPLFTHSVGDLLFAFNHISMWFGNYFILFIFLGKINTTKDFVPKVLKSYTLTALLIFLFFIVFYSVFGSSSIIHQFAVNDVVALTPELSSLIKIDWFTVFFYSFALILHALIQFYYVFYCIKEVFNMPHNKFTVVLHAIIFAIGYLILPFNAQQIVEFCSDTIGFYCFLVNFIFPLILLIILIITNKKYAKLKGEKYYAHSLEKK